MGEIMKTFKVRVWEKISVWQQVTLHIKAKSRKELNALLKSGDFSYGENLNDIVDCSDFKEDWHTERHMEYDISDYKILSEQEK